MNTVNWCKEYIRNCLLDITFINDVNNPRDPVMKNKRKTSVVFRVAGAALAVFSGLKLYSALLSGSTLGILLNAINIGVGRDISVIGLNLRAELPSLRGENVPKDFRRAESLEGSFCQNILCWRKAQDQYFAGTWIAQNVVGFFRGQEAEEMV